MHVVVYVSANGVCGAQVCVMRCAHVVAYEVLLVCVERCVIF